jgi:hypothetical protein
MCPTYVWKVGKSKWVNYFGMEETELLAAKVICEKVSVVDSDVLIIRKHSESMPVRVGLIRGDDGKTRAVSL